MELSDLGMLIVVTAMYYISSTLPWGVLPGHSSSVIAYASVHSVRKLKLSIYDGGTKDGLLFKLPLI